MLIYQGNQHIMYLRVEMDHKNLQNSREKDKQKSSYTKQSMSFLAANEIGQGSFMFIR